MKPSLHGTTTTVTPNNDTKSDESFIVELKDDDFDDDDDNSNHNDIEKEKEHTLVFENYLYHLLYAGQQLLQLDTEQDDPTNTTMEDTTTIRTSTEVTTEEDVERQHQEALECHRNYHAQQLQAFIASKQKNSNTVSTSAIPQLMDELMALLLQMGQLSFISALPSSPSSSHHRSKLYQFCLPPRPPDHIYYAHDLRPTTRRTASTTFGTTQTEHDDMDVEELEEDGDAEQSRVPVDTSYQYRRIDLVRRFLRSLSPIAIDIVARMVERCDTNDSHETTTNHQNTFATYILLGIWLPVAPHILPLVTHFLQLRVPPPEGMRHNDEDESSNKSRYQLHHPLYYAKQLWWEAIRDQESTVSLSTPVLSSSSSSSSTTTRMQQICIIMEVTWTICQIYRTQQNSQTLRNLNTWFWEPIFMWLQYDNHTIGVPQNNYLPPRHEHLDHHPNTCDGDMEQPPLDRTTTSTTTGHQRSDDDIADIDADAMMVDPSPQSPDEMIHHNRDDIKQDSEEDDDDDDDDSENRQKFRITREEWTYEIQIMWYVIQIVAYLRKYTPIFTKELMLRYDVYYHHHYVPWHIHDYDMNDEETFYQHIHVIFRYTYLGPYLSHSKNQVTLPKIRTVRALIPLHPYLIHLGRGLVFVKYPLMNIFKSIGTTAATMKNSNNDSTNDKKASPQMADVATFHSTQYQEPPRLIRTASTKKNIYEIGTIMCVQPPVPILIAGPNGSGKSSLVREIANEFHCLASGHSAGAVNDPPLPDTPLLEIHVDDETDTKTLVGSYTVTDIPGEFEWRPGALTSAVMSGQWVLFEDFDTVAIDIQASLEPLFKYRTLPLGNGTTITCHPNFRLFGTITTTCSTASRNLLSRSDSEQANMHPQARRHNTIVGRGRRLFNEHIWTTVYVDPLPINELTEIGMTKFPNIPHKILDAIICIFYSLQDDSHQTSNNNYSLGKGYHGVNDQNAYKMSNKKLWVGRSPSVRDLIKVLSRISHGIQFERNASYATESQRVLCLAEIVDIFAAACPDPQIRREFITQIVAPILNITADLGISYAEHRNPTILFHDSTTEIGRVQIGVNPEQGDARSNSDRFAQTPYSLRLMESIGVCIRENEPTLLVGETGTGKTTILQHLAKCCGRELIVQNLSLQTDSTDLLGGYRPLEIKHVARNVYQTFVDLFTGTFSRKQNAEFLTFASMSLQKEQWTKLSQCFSKAVQLGLAKMKTKNFGSSIISAWESFSKTAKRFEKQRIACESGLAFNFTEGALVDAIRTGKWVLLDEINLASSETLQRLCGLLDSNSSSLTLTERGDAVAVVRHSSFRLFAAMNPATDSGKKDLTAGIRARFTEIFVDELLDPVQLRIVASRYISGVLPKDERPPEHTDIIITVVDMYLQCRDLADRVLVDGSGQKPRYTLRTLTRALSATNTIVRKQKLPLNRALYEGFHLAFEGPLDEKSLKMVDKLLMRTFLIGAERSMLDHPGIRPGGRSAENNYELIKPFWIAKGPLVSLDWSIKDEKTGCSRFILVPSTESNLRRLVRAISSGPWPILLEGPTSAGKTTLVEYIAARCGHHVVRINNHEHTDVQEYTGGFAADSTGSLKFIDGILVQALRLGHWVILDELNLAPSEVLEALNRLLDDNRELYIPEINETVKPHESFRLFATQNPSGAYGGRKPLSRAFRNRFVEIQINDIPSYEMITILEKRCGCPPSHAKCLVEVMDSLRQRRSKSGIFLGKDGLITPRDLLRWANRASSSKYELALEGYMLLAERLRSSEEQQCVKEVLEMHLKVKLDIDSFYYGNESEAKVFLERAYEIDDFDESLLSFMKSVAPTRNLLRLITLVHRCVKQNEPVLLIGETGCGKTVTVQLLSALLRTPLHIVNCHQTTETSDLIGGLRPVRGRNLLISKIINLAQQVFALLPDKDCIPSSLDIPDMIRSNVVLCDSVVPPNDLTLKILKFVISVRATMAFSENCDSKLADRTKKRPKLDDQLNCFEENTGVLLDIRKKCEEIERLCSRYNALFEWADGPLVTAMKNGELILLDEISLADDAVLERLNSVLEPARTIVLAEKGAVDDNDSQYIKAQQKFQLFATMNPGGDFGKRELSPALRSRFTEIWVPPVSDFEDIGLVLENALARCSLYPPSLTSKPRILEYVKWFNAEVCRDLGCSYASLSLSLRDILSWAHFMVESRKANNNLGIWEAYRHGARLMHLDGLGLGGGLSIRDANMIQNRAESFMLQQISTESHQSEALSPLKVATPENFFGICPFWIPLGNQPRRTHSFNFGAPTTAKNVFRVLRALQVSKPILLEGSPGVGKTTLIGALAESTGHTLIRINLSEQTDISDLIGSDLPVSDNNDTSSSLGSSFRWFDGVLLSAIKNGDWVLLDELNLASQSVLEGLNSCLDHRSSVFVPELGQSFNCPPSFRIFAAQNPMGQGGGRKGLPKSFLNRFTKVYVDSLDYNDLQMIVKSSFPDQSHVDKMVMFNSKVSNACIDGGDLGRLGSPWEFNLRDVFRWCELFTYNKRRRNCNPGKSLCHFRFARDLYRNRFRTVGDRDMVKLIYDGVFEVVVNDTEPPTMVASGKSISIGDVRLPRNSSLQSSMYEMDDLDLSLPVQLFEPMEAAARCVIMGWPCLLVGKALSGKNTIVRSLAKLTNSTISEVCLSSSSDVSELVGCFERDDYFDLVKDNTSTLIRSVDKLLLSSLSCRDREIITVLSYRLEQALRAIGSHIDEVVLNGLKLAQKLSSLSQSSEQKNEMERLVIFLQNMSEQGKNGVSSSAHFAWKDGALVKAMKEGHWLHLRNANLCSSSVLDRLNSVLEPRGYLLLAESGICENTISSKFREIKGHPNFRVFLSMNPDNGEVSRAMRNRCVEVSILERAANESMDVLDSCKAFSKSGLRIAELASNALKSIYTKNYGMCISSSLRSLEIRFSVFASLSSRGMQRISPLLPNDLTGTAVKVSGNSIESVPHMGGIRNWAIFPEYATVQFWAMVIRAFVGPLSSLLFDSNIPAAVSVLWKQVIDGATATPDIFSTLTRSGESKTSIRDHLMSLLLAKAVPSLLPKVALYFEQISSPITSSIHFCADAVAHCQTQSHHRYAPGGEPTSEGAFEQHLNHTLPLMARIQTRRVPQIFLEQLWLEKANVAIDIVRSYYKMSVLDVSYHLSVGSHKVRVVDCPVTPFLWIFFQCLDDAVRSILKNALTLVDAALVKLVNEFFTQRDGLWNFLVKLQFVPTQVGRPCFAIDDFMAHWLLLRQAFEKVQPYFSTISKKSDGKEQLHVIIETINQGIFDYSKGETLCGSSLMRKECSPAVPRHVEAWNLLLKARKIGRMCRVDRQSLSTKYRPSMMMIRDCYERFPVLFVLNRTFKKEFLGMLCTIQMDDLKETSIQSSDMLHSAVSKVPVVLEKQLRQMLINFQSELNSIHQNHTADSWSLNVEELVDALERNNTVQDAYISVSERLLKTFADIQVAPCFENWCQRIEVDLFRTFCSILVAEKSGNIHESMMSSLVFLKKFVNIAISQPLWDFADLQPYQTIIWLCEGNHVSDLDWCRCIKKLMPTILRNVAKHTWLRSLELYQCTSLLLEVPSIYDVVDSTDFSGLSRTETEKQTIACPRRTNGQGLTMSLVFSLLHNAFQFEDTQPSRVKFATIENYKLREVQACRLVELMSARDAKSQDRPYDVAFLYDEVIIGCSELLPNKLLQGLTSFIYDPQVHRDRTYDELLQFGMGNNSSILRDCVHHILLPLLRCLENLFSSDLISSTLDYALSKIYIGLLRFHLLLPTSPVDPGRFPISQIALIDRRLSSLGSELAALKLDCVSTMGPNFTGNDATARVMTEGNELLTSRREFEINVIDRPKNGPAFSELYDETLAFSRAQFSFETVLSLRDCISSVDLDSEHEASAHQRERNWQSTTEAFCENLILKYEEYEDIVVPLMSSVGIAKQGIQLFLENTAGKVNDDVLSIVYSSSKFPLCELPTTPDNLTGVLRSGAFKTIHRQEFRCAVSQSILSQIVLKSKVDILDDNIMSIWLNVLDSITDQLNEQTESLLPIEMSDVDKEIDLHEQFPNHRLALLHDTTDTDDIEKIGNLEAPALSDSFRETLCFLHQKLFGDSKKTIDDSYRIVMFRLCFNAAQKANELFGNNCSDECIYTTCTPGLVMALALISPSSQHLLIRNRIFESSIDFHRDPNPQESVKAGGPLRRLLAKITQLQSIFSDNTILGEIAKVCDRVSKLDLHRTSLGRVLTGLELILKQAQDWEQHATVRVQLGDPLIEIRRLVTLWRKLELQSWAELLSTREARFARRGREHWTRIHIILRRFIATLTGAKVSTSCIGTPQWAWKGIRQDAHKLTFFLPKGTEELYEIMKVFDTFCLTAPLGEFHTRLQLLKSFTCQIKVEASISPAKPALLQLSLSLQALWQYYEQFSALVKSTLANQRRPLETRLEQEIKLAKWDEQTYYALAESSERNHRKLMNIVFDYDKILVLNVMTCIDAELSRGVQSDINSGVCSNATIPAPMLLFPLETVVDPVNSVYQHPILGTDSTRVWTDASQISTTQGQYFYKLSQLSKRMIALLEKPIGSLPNKGFCAVHEFCESIFERIESLRSEKTTRPMKERALTDLFKELKRQGYSPNKWSTPTEMKQISELFQLPCPTGGIDDCHFIDSNLAESSELYYQRCLAETYRFRAELSMFGSEYLSARQLEMMHGFSENGLFLVVQQRCIISCILAQRHQLAKLVDSLTSLSVKDLLLHQNARKAAYLTLRKEIAFCLESLRQLVLLIKSSQHLMDTNIKRNWSSEVIARIEASIASVDVPPCLDQYDVVSTKEIDNVQQMKSDLDKVMHTTRECREEAVLKEYFPQAAFSTCENQMSSLVGSINMFLRDVQTIGKCIPEADAHAVSFSHASYTAINDALVFAQTCVVAIDANDNETHDQTTRSIWDLHIITARTWKTLNVRNMIISVESVLKELTAIHETENIDKHTRDLCTGFSCDLGYLYNIVLSLHDKILNEHILFYRGTTKLQYIILRLFRVLRASGFCSSTSKEIDKQDNADGTTSGMTFEDNKEGTGMGEGDGKTDVTDQLENEEQLLGLKNDKEDADSMKSPPDPKQLNKDEADQGMEMEGDFDGELYDLPDETDADGDDDKDNTSDKEEIDREMGQDGSPNDQVIDEKLWDEDDDHNTQDTKDEKFEQNNSVQGDGATDEMITRDESEGKDESKDMEHQNDTQQGKNDDIRDDEELGKINDDTDENYEEDQGVNVRDETQINDEADGINIDESLAMDEDPGENDDEKTSDSADESDHEGEEAATDINEPLAAEEDTESVNENDAEPAPEGISSFGQIQPIEDDCPDNELPNEEQNLPKASLPKEKTPQSGLGVRDRDGGDALQEDTTLEESEEMQKDTEGKGADDGSGKMDTSSSGGGQGAGSAIGQIVSDTPDVSSAQSESNEIPNPLKNPGDASKFWHRKLNVMTPIIDEDNDGDSMDDGLDDKNGEGNFEYTDEKQRNTTQTLGDADENNVVQLEQEKMDEKSELNDMQEISNSETVTEASNKPDRRKKQSSASEDNKDRIEDTPLNETAKDVSELENNADQDEKALMTEEIGQQMDENQNEIQENHVVSDLQQLRFEDDDVHLFNGRQNIVEIEQTTGHSTSEVSDSLQRWSEIQSETHSLSRRLCEKLRLVMEPLVASKLRGDYRTGKRINMKRVIGYIASGYRKDKIWLRRTKPAKRNYRVLVAVDDSESMLKNGAGDMALKAMATLAVGMSQLEVGEVGIASFGNEMNLVHPFELPFTLESGSNIIRSFQFKQQRTRTALCIESALLALEGHHGDQSAMQLVFLISDGRIERDSRSSIRKYIREMMEQNILLVLIIVEGSDSRKDSIMNMKEVTFDKGKPQFKHFIDDYPFPYYIVLNDMQSLPEVLGDALKQWFEMLARLQQSNT